MATSRDRLVLLLSYAIGWYETLSTFQGWLRIAETLGKLAVIFAIAQWFYESGDRRETRHAQAWTLIMLARGAPADAGRVQALTRLNRDGVDLGGVPLSGARLVDLNLRNAFMDNADFSHAQLDDCDFYKSIMRFADFRGARLECTFRESHLLGADFRGARFPNLDGGNAKIHAASVLGANFQGAAVAEIDAHQCGTIMSSGAVSDRDCTESDIRWLKRNADLLPR